MRRLFSALVVALLVSCIGLPLQALDSSDCLFYVPFEGDVKPVIYAGSPEPVSVGSLHFTDGVRGRAVVIGGVEKPGGPGIVYQAKDNFRPDKGAIAFWAKCIGEANFASSGGYYTFVSWATPPYSWMFYRFGAGGNTGGLVQKAGKTIWANWGYATNWDAGVWNHIVFTWQSGESRWYVNGKLVNRITENVPISSELSKGIGIGTLRKAKAALDELYFFKRPLSDYEAKAIYDLGSGLLKSPSVTIPLCEKPPVIDGVLKKEEWSKAAGISGFTDEATGALLSEPTSAYITYDSSNLYLAFDYPIPEIVRKRPDFFPGGPLRRAVSKHDGELERDDCYGVEIERADGKRFLIAANAIGTVYDASDGDASWESGAVAKARDDEKDWTLEIALPFSSLGVTPEPGGKINLNLWRIFRVVRKTRAVWSAGAEPGVVRFGGETPVARLKRLGDLNAGSFDIELELVGAKGSASEIVSKVELPSMKPFEKEKSLEPGAGAEVKVTGKFPGPVQGPIHILVSTKGQSLYEGFVPVNFSPLLQASTYFYPTEDLLEVEIDRTALGWKKPSAEVALIDKKTDKVLATGSIEEFRKDKEIASIDTSSVPPGAYLVKVTLKGEGGLETTLETRFRKSPKPEWLGNKVGITGKVPSPWTPIEASETKFGVWGRQYDCTASLLFRQITSNGKELLAGPVRLVVKRDQKEETLVSAEVKIEAKNEQKVELSSKAAGKLLNVTAKTLIEFDGFTFTDLTLAPEKPVEITGLDLEIPFKPEFARLLFSGNYNGKDSGAIPPEGWKSDHGPNFQWVGDVDAGIQFYYQDQVGWNVTNKQVQAEIIRRKGEVVYRVPFIDTPTRLEKPLKISFGLMATPVKPRHPKWRKWWVSYTPLEDQIALALWYSDWGEGDNIPRMKPSQKGREAGGAWTTVREKHEKGVIVTPYVSGQVAWVYAPEYQEYKEEWRVVPSERVKIEEGEKKNWWKAGMVCPASSFKDFWLYYMQKTVKEADFHGLYFDNMFPAPCANTHHGCGAVEPSGKVVPRLPLFATREWLRRTYVMMKEHDPESVIVYHMSGAPWMPYCAYSDLMMPGEQYASGLGIRLSAGKPDNYYDILTLDHMQAEFMGYNWGPACGFLTEFAAPKAIHGYPNRKSPRPSRYFEDSPVALREINHVVGMLLLHDSVLPWPFQCNAKPFILARRAQLNFGWDEKVEYVPYWDNPYVKLEAGEVEPVVCAIFKRPGRAMFVVMNNSDEDATVTLSIDYKALGFRPEDENRLTDSVTGAMFGYNGKEDSVTFPIGARSFRALVTGGDAYNLF